MLRGVKPVLLAGTEGRFDAHFQLLRVPIEMAVEHWWASKRHSIHIDTPAYPELRMGNHREWLASEPRELGEYSFVISETLNPDWCFAAYFTRRGQRSVVFSPNFFGNFVSARPEIFDICFDVHNEEMPTIGFTFVDCRCGYRPLADMWIQRFRGKMDSSFVNKTQDQLPGELPYEGRGWKKLNHEHIYSLCAARQLDLQDSNFLSGRFVLVNQEDRF